MIGKTMIATLGENHAEGFSIHENYCNKESLHHPLQLTVPLRTTGRVHELKIIRLDNHKIDNYGKYFK